MQIQRLGNRKLASKITMLLRDTNGTRLSAKNMFSGQMWSRVAANSLLVAFTFILSNQVGLAQHRHDNHEAKSVRLNDLLKGFNNDSAVQVMDNLGIVASERKSYLKMMQRKYLKSRYPTFYAETIVPPYSQKPQGVVKSSRSDNPSCPNAGFDNLDFANWSGGIAEYGDVFNNTTIVSNGLNANILDDMSRHTINTVPPINNNPNNGPVNGYDPLAINPTTGLADIPFLAPNGGIASIRLGNAASDSEIERLYYDMDVTVDNNSFSYQFAIVLQDPEHEPEEQPYFRITVKDESGNQIGGPCGIYTVDATLAATDPTFVQTEYDDDILYYRPWSLVSVDLTPYIGTTVRIEFETADCSLGAHFGYAYIDASCGMIELAASFCQGQDSAILAAPVGFENYQWYGPNSDTQLIPNATNDSLSIAAPAVGDVYYVSVMSASGCPSQFQSTLSYTTISVGNLEWTNSCPAGASGTATVTGQGSSLGYTYLWTPGDFATSSVTSLSAGDYQVQISASEGDCGMADTIVTVGVNPVLPLEFTANYCTNTNVPIVALDGTSIQWYGTNGAAIAGPAGTNDTLIIASASNGQVVSYGFTTLEGCRDSAIVTLDYTPISSVLNTDVLSCASASVDYYFSENFTYTYNVTGPSYNYTLANTSLSSITLTNLLSGNYQVTVNDGGCAITESFTIQNILTNPTEDASLCPYGTQELVSPSSGSHTWTTPNGEQFTGPSISYNFPNGDPIPGIYIDTCVTSSGCIDVTPFLVSIIPTTINPIETLNPCPLEDVSVASTNSGMHYWFNPMDALVLSTSSSSATLSQIAQGTYTDSCITNLGCITITDYEVTYDTIIATSSQMNLHCYADSNGTATITIVSGPSGSYQYNWTGPLGYSATGAAQNDLFAGVFDVETVNGNCVTNTTLQITSPPQPADTLKITTAFCDHASLAVLHAPVGFMDYQWMQNGVNLASQTSDTIVINDLAAFESFHVTYLIDQNGCRRKTSVVEWTPVGPVFLPSDYPNIFTPNGDGINDMFYPFNPMEYSPAYINYLSEEYKLNIYSRWGKHLFSSELFSEGWDGKVNNGDCEHGVYYWTVHFKPFCTETQITDMNGVVHLLR